MQYLLLIYSNEALWKNMAPAEASRMTEAYRAYSQDIVKSGHFRAGARLEPSFTAKCVKKTGNTDGPYAETKEQLGGYFLVECKDIDEATALAKRIPSVELGETIEVRPIVYMP